MHAAVRSGELHAIRDFHRGGPGCAAPARDPHAYVRMLFARTLDQRVNKPVVAEIAACIAVFSAALLRPAGDANAVALMGLAIWHDPIDFDALNIYGTETGLI